jgi:hypothetical protein
LYLVFCSGCGLIFQTIVGWNNAESVKKTESKTVEVTSVPPGAQVTRRDPSGQEVAVGTAPLNDPLSYEVEQTVESPSVWALVTGGLIDTVGGIALVALGISSVSSAGSSPDVASGGADASLGALGATMGSLVVLTGLSELVVALIHGSSSPSVANRKIVGGAAGYAYTGKLSGLPEAVALVKVPDQSKAQIVLDPNAMAQLAELQRQQKGKAASGSETSGKSASGSNGGTSSGMGATTTNVVANSATSGASEVSASSGSSGSGAQVGASWVIAVMDVEDLNAASREKAIDPSLVRNLGDQIRIFIAERGVRTIDRGTQDKAIKDQISTMKKESYKSCYDDSCQIELGKAMAASHILRSRITRFGRRCVLNAELIDLRSEVTMAAASSQGDCEAEGFLAMSEHVTSNLIRK